MADATDLKSVFGKPECGFESRHRQQVFIELRIQTIGITRSPFRIRIGSRHAAIFLLARGAQLFHPQKLPNQYFRLPTDDPQTVSSREEQPDSKIADMNGGEERRSILGITSADGAPAFEVKEGILDQMTVVVARDAAVSFGRNDGSYPLVGASWRMALVS